MRPTSVGGVGLWRSLQLLVRVDVLLDGSNRWWRSAEFGNRVQAIGCSHQALQRGQSEWLRRMTEFFAMKLLNFVCFGLKITSRNISFLHRIIRED